MPWAGLGEQGASSLFKEYGVNSALFKEYGVNKSALFKEYGVNKF